MSRKLLWDKKRHENKINKGVYVEGLTIDQIKTYLDGGYKLHGIDAWIEFDVSALDLQVLHTEGFDVSIGHYVIFSDYTLWRKNLAKDKVMLKIGSNSPIWEEIATHDQLNAYLNKFGGKDNLYDNPWDEPKKEEYYIKSKDELEAMTWTNLKKYLKDHNIDGSYNLQDESQTRTALYEDIENKVYDVNREV